MPSITQQRIEELHVLYDQIKQACQEIDNKYSLVAQEPPLRMPETLGLTPLEYTPRTEEELRTLAAQKVAASMLSKQRSAERSYSSQLKSVSQQKSKATSECDAKIAAALFAYNKEKEELDHKIVDNGLYFSTLVVRYSELATKRYSENVKTITAKLQSTMERLDEQEQYAEEQYTATLASLEQERQASEQVAYDKYREEDERQRLSVEKYNTGLVEKEQKYQASRAKAYEAAYRAQQNKALQNAKLYSELGEVGYRDMIQREQYAVVTDMCLTLNRTEATVLTSFDTYLTATLGDYYDAFIHWINTVLLP